MAFGDVLATASNTAASISNPFAVSAGFAVSPGNLVVVAVAQRTTLSASAMTDGLGNTFTAFSSGFDGGNATIRGYYSIITTSGTCTPSVVTTSGTEDGAIVAVGFEGPFAASPLDANPTIVQDTATPFTGPATGTLAQDDELIVAYIGMANGRAMTATSPSSLTLSVISGLEGAANTIGCAVARQVVAATTSVAPAWTAGGTLSSDGLGTVSFKKEATSISSMAWLGFYDQIPTRGYEIISY